MENKKYDLEKAKEDCRRHEDALEEAQSCMCGHCHECGFDPSEMKAALDEVERLRSERDYWRQLFQNIQGDRDLLIERDARIKELEAALEDVGDCQSIAYMLGGKKKAEENKILIDYIKRLEAAFLDHLAARLYYEHYPGVSDAYSWHDYPEDACHSMPKEEFRKKAREALEEIKTGGKDE